MSCPAARTSPGYCYRRRQAKSRAGMAMQGRPSLQVRPITIDKPRDRTF